ncbi:RNA polymerase factor sigma-54 [Pseudogracilibacillus sp. ICA-222130]|uniref:RNA polymerase factor sigma-54 n=1 Tax=Pseudogracilibacillus sp. ICA-222130 TaxID=3134655 RepID=UPI0030BD8542
MHIRLEQKQTLQLAMTKDLRQAIELLQFSTVELQEFVRAKVEENPFIEWNEPPSTYRSTELSTHDVITATAYEEKDLYDVLIEQLAIFSLSDEDRKVVEYIIYSLEEDGYLRTERKDIIRHLHILPEQFDRALHIVHQLEPIGVGATSLVDCLLIQAKHLAPHDELLHQLIENHLVEIGYGETEQIAKQLQTSIEAVEEKMEWIKHNLHPKPANHLAKKETVYIEPDIIVEHDEALGEWVVHLNDDYVSKLTFNDDAILMQTNEKEVQTYVQRYRSKFNWLMASLEKRRVTLLNIMYVIIQKQQHVFHKGLTYVEPLTLRTVADKIAMHESTVSRATANKFIQTPIGTFALRDLFSTALPTVTGKTLSQKHIKEKVRTWIQEEDKKHPLSDQDITEMLQEEGVMISRRTIAKYRKQLQIAPSTKRKQKE